MSGEVEYRQCPFCKEQIRADAILCKHCRSAVAPDKPAHGGTCPYCKESINPEAIKCKHCGSDLRVSGKGSDCGCVGSKANPMAMVGVGGLTFPFSPSGSSPLAPPLQGNIVLKACLDECTGRYLDNPEALERCTQYCHCLFYNKLNPLRCLIDLIQS